MNRRQRRAMSPLDKSKNRSEGEQALMQDPKMRDALQLIAALNIATGAKFFDADIGLVDKETEEVRTFRIHVDMVETTKK